MGINKNNKTMITIRFANVQKGFIFRIFGREFKSSTIMFNIYIPIEKRNLLNEDIPLSNLCGYNTNVVDFINEIQLIEGLIVLYSKLNEDLSTIKVSIFTPENILVNHLKVIGSNND